MPIEITYQYKVIAVTPAGRKKYLSLLIPCILRYYEAGMLDEYHLWINTKNTDDIEYMKKMCHKYSKFIKLKTLPDGIEPNGNSTIHHFFRDCIDDNTVYVRFDDDVIVLDDTHAFKKFIEFRVRNPQYFMVYANILNNAVISSILQRFKKLDLTQGISGGTCMDNIGWKSPEFAHNLHDQVIAALKKEKSLQRFRFEGEWFLYNKDRVSINCISWIGSEFRASCNGIIAHDEEKDIAEDIPHRTNKYNTIYGGFCCVHYAFYTQRDHLDSLGYEEKYREVSKIDD